MNHRFTDPRLNCVFHFIFHFLEDKPPEMQHLVLEGVLGEAAWEETTCIILRCSEGAIVWKRWGGAVFADMVQERSLHVVFLFVNPPRCLPGQSEKRCLISHYLQFSLCVRILTRASRFHSAHRSLFALLRSISTMGDLFSSRSSALRDLVSARLLCGASETAADTQKAAASV